MYNSKPPPAHVVLSLRVAVQWLIVTASSEVLASRQVSTRAIINSDEVLEAMALASMRLEDTL